MRAVDDFEDVSILDNFYQTSSFFPMPVVLVGTLAENGQTNLGPYSLCFPHVVSGQHAMMLIARGTSNTAANIRRTGRATINFIPDDRALLENCVLLRFPGETTEDIMTRIHRAQLSDIRIDWGGVDVLETYPATIPELWAGRPVILFGLYRNGRDATLTVSGNVEGHAVSWPSPSPATWRAMP